MALSKEELLKPRIKIIAPWPGMECQVGDIINIPSPDWVYSKKEHCDADYFMYWPHLFRKLEWWEERTNEELPKYVKDDEGRMGILGERYSHNLKNCVNVTFANRNAVVAHFDNFKPVDEEEYNQYIKQQSNQ